MPTCVIAFPGHPCHRASHLLINTIVCFTEVFKFYQKPNRLANGKNLARNDGNKRHEAPRPCVRFSCIDCAIEVLITSAMYKYKKSQHGSLADVHAAEVDDGSCTTYL